MRAKHFALCTSSIAVLAALTPPALAQTAPAGSPDQAQTTPAVPPSPEGDDPVQTATDAAGDEEIVVTGLRRSLESAQNIKQNSLAIVDAIVAEDIGKLPDRTVSESLARVPGVTVERQVGEAGDVFIRGLRDPATTYNGRDIFTAEARNVAPQDFPAGGVAALEVYKATTAEQVEGNLAGLINVRSRRPFDFRGFELSGQLNGTYADLADDIAYNGNLLVSNRWETGAGEFGALLNVSNTTLEYLDSARFVSGDFFGIDPVAGQPGAFRDNLGTNTAQTARAPVGVGLFQSPGKRTRPSVNAALQWRPNDELEFYVDGLFQGFRREVSDRLLFVPVFGGDATYTNVQFREGTRFVGALNAAGQARPDGFQGATKEKTDTYQVAVGGIYDTDRFRAAVDLARTDSQFDLSIYSVDYALNAAPPLDVVFDVPRGDGGAEFSFGNNFDTTDLGNYVYRGFFDRFLRAKGDDYQARADFELKEMAEWLPRLQFGVRFVDRDGGFRDGSRYAPSPTSGPGARAYGSLPLEFAVTRDGYRGGIQPVRQLNLPTYDSIRGAIGELRTIAGFAQGLPPADPLITYAADEKSYTGYGQINYEFDVGDVTLDGVVGLRAVRTEFDVSGNVFDAQQNALVPLDIGNNYMDYLPNASLRARLAEGVQIRASYTETRTRPGFGQLNPGLRIDPPGGSPIRTARGGNPNLQPVESTNYDLSLEYYFSRSGFTSLSLFRRDVSGFIVNLSQQAEIPGFGTVNIFGPVNADEGRIQGVEAQFRTFLDFDFVPGWARGFGTELNLTYIDNELGQLRFPDVSKWSYNIVGFYEQGPVTARVAYNRRTNYAQGFEIAANGTLATEFVGDVSRLDASLSYALTENLTLTAAVDNILADPFRNFSTEGGLIYPRDVRYEERIYTLGVRFRL